MKIKIKTMKDLLKISKSYPMLANGEFSIFLESVIPNQALFNPKIMFQLCEKEIEVDENYYEAGYGYVLTFKEKEYSIKISEWMIDK